MLSVNQVETKESAKEELRLQSLEELAPKRRRTLLDVGARDGRVTARLAPYYKQVTALDLQKPHIDLRNVCCVAGDATSLPYADNYFDVVVCSEVIEHIPDVARACQELRRVARHEILIGVPYKQDLRVRRVTCQACGKPQPPNGHLHTFDETTLLKLVGLPIAEKQFVGTRQQVTTDLGRVLMDWAGNPWGSYTQREPCLYCNARLVRPTDRPLFQRGLGVVALGIQKAVTALQKPQAAWIHVLFRKG